MNMNMNIDAQTDTTGSCNGSGCEGADSAVATAAASNEKTISLLDKIYKNVRMGSQSIIDVMPKIGNDGDCEGFRGELTGQLTEYEKLSSKASELLKAAGKKPEDESIMTKISAKIGMMMNTMADSSIPHIAEMVIKGSTMGVTELGRLRHECDGSECSETAIRLADEVIKFEEDCVEMMKKYL